MVLAGPDALVRASATGEPLPLITLPSYKNREEWYRVIWQGFNQIDTACMLYINGLWKLERQKTRNSTIIHALGATGGALLGAARPTPSTTAGLVLMSQVFGLAGVLNNAIADSYLYSQSAANVYNLVKVTTDAYRDDLAKNYYPDRTDKNLPPEIAYPMGSVPAAYFHMREYLSLCLPPAIQGQVDKLVAGAQAAPAGSPEERKAKERKLAGGSAPAASVVRFAPRTSPRPSVF
jgi:hypothetical protein